MKLDRIAQDIATAQKKAAHWQNRVEELQKLYQETENTEIIQLVREVGMTPAQLAEFLKKQSLTEVIRDEK